MDDFEDDGIREVAAWHADLAWLHLDDLWKDLRNNASPERMAHMRGAIDAFAAIDALDPTEHELWLRRIETCPGHDDEGGRAWCAYCGDLEP